jgi:hypothetical protein
MLLAKLLVRHALELTEKHIDGQKKAVEGDGNSLDIRGASGFGMSDYSYYSEGDEGDTYPSFYF